MLKTKKKNRIRPESVMGDGESRIDPVRGINRNVKILGLKSRHGYAYAPAALKNAIPLFEGVRVNLDHPDRKNPGMARSVRDRFGSFRNVRFVEGDGLRGDHYFNPKHAYAPTYIWDAQNDPAACGFSQNARGPLTEGKNGLVCESIKAVRSVDLVADAATTRSLYEGMPSMKVRKRGKVQRRRLSPEGRNQVRRTLFKKFGREIARQLIEDMGGVDAAAPLAKAEPGADGGVEALISLVRSVLANPNISADESIKQVNKRLKALKDMIPGGVAAKGPSEDPAALAEGMGDDEDEEEDDDEDTSPRRKRKDDERLEGVIEFVETLRERQAIDDLCNEHEFKPTAKQRKLLEGVVDDEAREELIESWQDDADNPRKPVKGKARAKELQEGDAGKKPEYKSSKDWVRGLK